MMLAAQRLSLRPGMTPRRMVRVARALQVEIEIEGQKIRSFTLDFSTGGFSTTLPRPPSIGTDMTASLRLPAEAPVLCRARVTDVRAIGDHHRVSARFLDLTAEDRERLELFVFDAVLAQLR
jgi:c-di-GMP-binding flagellar brake protein YcgR